MLIHIQHLSAADYSSVYRYMLESVHHGTRHELLCVEHTPVFTLGLRQKNIPHPDIISGIPVVQTDRGGLTTYHGPGQIVLYPLCHLPSLQMHPSAFVHTIEEITCRTLDCFGIHASADAARPGLYIHGQKIASVGLRAKNNRIYHGIAINHNMDLSPFDKIVPCGYDNLKMTQIADYTDITRGLFIERFIREFTSHFALEASYDRQTA